MPFGYECVRLPNQHGKKLFQCFIAMTRIPEFVRSHQDLSVITKCTAIRNGFCKLTDDIPPVLCYFRSVDATSGDNPLRKE
jgi:hypothetical protein